ncbi:MULTISPECIES: phosphate acyltransferase PlsX [unclassified Psychrobacillus]|uniref:phosphate acyltransferase PlsX n=1 Tax=unclassified Psychrobacillus TaxID=2636677 RepID=UPI00146C98F4|nr:MULTISPECIES: phosphate acyltransferase PlsX [unclassified Psychrobacillus]MCM3356966.1 phosphate acyltransferase PlsX [Psychrobacillus sp. MER TA 171]NME04803.1 phosphate acyltransferase PlsX [Psychrobacillus sp. BL-248-WT-3]
MKISIDAMGGDNAPHEIVKGAYEALEAFDDLNIILYGDESKLESLVTKHDRLTVVHTDEVIEGTDEPVRAIRRKKNSSMVKMAESVKNGEADACVSAGNTGALMAAGLFVVGRIDQVDRPALAPTLPTIDGKGFVMLDLGANSDAKPEHLQQFAVMGSVYAEKVRGIQNPRVGLLNIGTEDKKGNELTKAAFLLLKETPVNFIGNVESRDLLNGVADVVVTDGFTGNMVLKTIEGTAAAMFTLLKEAFNTSTKTKISALLVKDQLKGIKNKLDYSEYGGAGLFGLKAPVIKAHGSSNSRAIFHAIRQARTMVENNVSEIIYTTLRKESSDD